MARILNNNQMVPLHIPQNKEEQTSVKSVVGHIGNEIILINLKP
jgi:hypothetical protein